LNNKCYYQMREYEPPKTASEEVYASVGQDLKALRKAQESLQGRDIHSWPPIIAATILYGEYWLNRATMSTEDYQKVLERLELVNRRAHQWRRGTHEIAHNIEIMTKYPPLSWQMQIMPSC